jgi:hypothetical protein
MVNIRNILHECILELYYMNVYYVCMSNIYNSILYVCMHHIYNIRIYDMNVILYEEGEKKGVEGHRHRHMHRLLSLSLSHTHTHTHTHTVTIGSHVKGVGSRSGSFMICIKGISLLCSC